MSPRLDSPRTPRAGPGFLTLDRSFGSAGEQGRDGGDEQQSHRQIEEPEPSRALQEPADSDPEEGPERGAGIVHAGEGQRDRPDLERSPWRVVYALIAPTATTQP